MYNRTPTFSPTVREAILLRDNFVCVYCGEPAWQVDHVIPRSAGGPTRKFNGVACCKRCNSQKAARIEVPFLEMAIIHLSQCGEDTTWLDTFRGNAQDE